MFGSYTLLAAASTTFFATLSSASKAYNKSAAYETGLQGASPVQKYVAATDFTPVQLNYQIPLDDSTAAKLSPGLLFFAPYGDSVTQTGPLIVKQDGTIVWSGKDYSTSSSFMVENYQGEDHIILWTGEHEVGYGHGEWHILNSAYEEVATYTAVGLQNDTKCDFHDASYSFCSTLQSHIYNGETATMTAYVTEQHDLTPYGGPKDGYILNAVVQEINIATKEVVFEWHGLDHVDPSESYTNPLLTGYNSSAPWDYFHLNAIDKDSNGDYLISCRHCHSLLKVDKSSGDIVWRLNGKKSNFTMGKDASFSWQHDGRWRSDNTISLFDNAGTTLRQDRIASRGLLLSVDTDAMTVELVQEFDPVNKVISRSQGNNQLQPNGNFLVGYGAEPAFEEYDSEGNPLWAMQFAVINSDVAAFRTYRFDWHATPSTPPSLSIVGSSGSNRTAYAWWNGATDVATWALFGSVEEDGTSSSLVKVTREDFETAIAFDGWGDYGKYTVVALDGEGKVLGTSEAVNA
ncbi:ASST-domain-containing protein [Schizophyllum commune]